MSTDPMNEILIAVLEVLREQSIYLHRQHGWIIAVAETIEQSPDLVSHLRQHPFFDQGPRPDAYSTAVLLEKIDALIRKLKRRPEA
jgi:hypothetical protein